MSDDRTSHDALFIEHGEQLCAIDCHTVYTVPISMMYARKAMVLRSIFPDSRVLPMIKIREPKAKGDLTSAVGMEHIKQILAHRVDIERLANSDAIEYLCCASGGHPRDLMALVRHSIEYADETLERPITLNVAQHSEARLVAAFGRMIPDNSFEKLVRVHLENRIQNDTDHQKMLFSLSVLEYANGVEPWHDVHPAVQKLSRFQHALANERSKFTT